ncbi:hypothetical protein LTR08_007957 [Meristemomyces frigidus]|nr:hypothetical protein LTR08_007957 [Meristemomyces frigidus]
MTPSTLLALLATLPLALAAPTTSCPAPTAPTLPTSPNFRLIANITCEDLTPSLQNWPLTSYHTGAGTALAVLTPPTANATGRAFYLSGTVSDIQASNASVLSDGGTPPFPYGLVVPAASASGAQRAVQINAGDGTPGVNFSHSPPTSPFLTYDAAGAWYACNATLPYGPAVVLYYRSAGEGKPAGCAGVMLLPEW